LKSQLDLKPVQIQEFKTTVAQPSKPGPEPVFRLIPVSLTELNPPEPPQRVRGTASMCHSVPVLRVEEWPLPGDSLTGDTVRALIDRVNSSARGGVRFVGSVLQQVSGITNGRVHSPKRGCRSPPRTPPGTPPGDRELEENTYSPGETLRPPCWSSPGETLRPPPPADVYEGSNVKTDYGPLLHTLAEFGWLLTCVLPTPIIRHDSDGNLATKQVVFLQRLSVSSDVSGRSVSRSVSGPVQEDLVPAAGGIGGFPVFGGFSGSLAHLEEGGFEQEEGKAEVTCM
uniref:Raftlin family member 2 n=1 Tax=Acanthochromis polyacanthus TaxID=80966 RepID=A0A3Q1HRS5_9TELE